MLAKTKFFSLLPVKLNSALQLYDGTSVPLTVVSTSACSVPPTFSPFSFFTTVMDSLLREFPAADSQLIEAEMTAPGSALGE